MTHKFVVIDGIAGKFVPGLSCELCVFSRVQNNGSSSLCVEAPDCTGGHFQAVDKKSSAFLLAVLQGRVDEQITHKPFKTPTP